MEFTLWRAWKRDCRGAPSRPQVTNRENALPFPGRIFMENDLLIPERRTRAIVHALLSASGICVLLLGVRMVLTRDAAWACFVWNLFLAWVPLVLARMFCGELDRPGRRRWLLSGLFIGWFLFFPNAAYIVTDLIHLKNRQGVPRWFDYIFITSYAWTGLFLCYVSLRLVHARVQQWWGRGIGWAFATGMLAAGSFGIYVGRFFRWNSWDMIFRPWTTLKDLGRFAHPHNLLEAVAFSTTFFLLSLLVYTVLHALAHLHAPMPGAVVEQRPRESSE